MLTQFIKTMKLNKESKSELEKIMSLPEVEAILSREEEKTIASRRELIKRLADLPGEHAKNIEEKRRVAVAACQLVEKLEAELRTAMPAKLQALSQANYASNALHFETLDITKELREGRDRRLDAVYIELNKHYNLVENSVSVLPFMQRNYVVGYHSNVDDVRAAMAAIDSAKAELEKLAIAALSHSEMTEKIQSVFQNLAGPLSKLHLSAPYLDKDGEVKSVLSQDADNFREKFKSSIK